MLRIIKRLAKQDSWLLWDAVLLTLGFNPEISMAALIRRPNLQPGRDHFERDALARASYLADTARGSWRSGKLEIVNPKEVETDLSLFTLLDSSYPQAEVFPKPFLLWAQDSRIGLKRYRLSSVTPAPAPPAIALAAHSPYASVLFCLGLEKDLLLLGQDDPLGRKLQDAEITQTKERVAKRKKS